MRRVIYVIFILLLIGDYQAHARTRNLYTLPRMAHRKPTLRNYRLESKRAWSPCQKSHSKKTIGPDVQCYVQK